MEVWRYLTKRCDSVFVRHFCVATGNIDVLARVGPRDYMIQHISQITIRIYFVSCLLLSVSWTVCLLFDKQEKECAKNLK